MSERCHICGDEWHAGRDCRDMPPIYLPRKSDLFPVATATRRKAIGDQPRVIEVTVTWKGADLDRPVMGGFGINPGAVGLATRLVLAINAGKVYSNPRIRTDANGKTYVEADCAVCGRYMDSDLRALGF